VSVKQSHGAIVDRNLAKIRDLCLALPEASERVAWGHPTFHAGKRTFVTLEFIKGQPTVAFRLGRSGSSRLQEVPGVFPTPYGRGEWVSISAVGRMDWALVRGLILESYRLVALKRMLVALGIEARR
jgi:predicted DNA-binding protein (MmcQ/YjbR family)